MPLFGTDYEVERDPEAMSFLAHFDHGGSLMMTPHLCAAHQREGDLQDHRNYIDMTVFFREPVFGIPVPNTVTFDLEFASALVEAINEVAPWVRLNSEIDEDQRK